MARLTLESLMVTSFATQDESFAWDSEKVCTADISTCPRTTSPYCDKVCTADISTCPRTTAPLCEDLCTADISTCPRTTSPYC
jgi:hypothetical protein